MNEKENKKKAAYTLRMEPGKMWHLYATRPPGDQAFAIRSGIGNPPWTILTLLERQDIVYVA
jgi:hypothetical protein